MYAELSKFDRRDTGRKRPPIPPTKYSEIQNIEKTANPSSDKSP